MADDSNLHDGQSHAGRAGELEKDAANLFGFGTEGGDQKAAAVAAVALSHRTAHLAENVAELVEQGKRQ